MQESKKVLNYLKTLNDLNVNEAQYKAITHGDGAMLVLAGPGSGKTFTVTQRIKYLIEHHNVKPEDILVITFTKAAAQEMQERFVKLSNGKIYPVNFGTFHAVFFNILKRTYKFTSENIIREQDKFKLLSQIILEIPDEIKSQTDENINIENNTETLQRILSEVSKVKNSGVSPREIKSETVSQIKFEYIYNAYKKQMNKARLVDFDDMVLLCRNLLVSRPDVLKIWQERFKYILVDEFQDICDLQYEVIKLLAKPHDNLFIVGDDDQAIYGFRGSKPKIMLNFTNDYPNADKVLLNINYRSKKAIVETAGKLISNNKERYLKDITTHNQETGGVNIYSFSSKFQQAENIALLIKQYMENENSSYNDIAILYRTASHAVYTADKLTKEGIPFTLTESSKSIYDSVIAKDMISYMKYALYENSVEDFLRIMNKPVRYIKRNIVPVNTFKMEQILENNKIEDYVIQNIIQLYSELKFVKNLNPYSAVNYIRKGIGYDEYIKKQAKERGKNFDKEIDELDEFQQLAKGFETTKEWIEHIENYNEIVNRQRNKQNINRNAVNIMTMHASKGLEWKVVIIPDVNEGVVPHKKAITDLEIEEERRMFYVAMTRAKENLFIFYIKEKEAGNLLPSRFLDEII